MKAKTVEEFISGTFRTFFEFVADDQVNFRTIRHSADTTRVRMDTPEVIAGFEELREDIEKAITDGLFPPVDADFLMASIVGVAFEVGRTHDAPRKSRSGRRGDLRHGAVPGRHPHAAARRPPRSTQRRPRMKAIVCREIAEDIGTLRLEDIELPPLGRRTGARASARRGGELSRHPDRAGQIPAQARAALHARQRRRGRRHRGRRRRDECEGRRPRDRAAASAPMRRRCRSRPQRCARIPPASAMRRLPVSPSPISPPMSRWCAARSFRQANGCWCMARRAASVSPPSISASISARRSSRRPRPKTSASS